MKKLLFLLMILPGISFADLSDFKVATGICRAQMHRQKINGTHMFDNLSREVVLLIS